MSPGPTALRILFRPETGPAVGGGHAMRCLAIAEAAQAVGAEVAFALAPGLDLPRFTALGAPVLPPEPQACDVVVIDGYGLGADEQARWRALGAWVAVLDDAPGRTCACDLLIDCAPGRGPEAYAPFVPHGAKLMLGTAYAPLAAGFAAARPAALRRRARGEALTRVLVSPGLMDVGGIAPAALDGLGDLPGLTRIDVAVGADAPSAPELALRAADDPRIRLHLDAEDMASLMLEADLAVGAAGVSTWERCALGLPSLVVVAAANQAGNAAVIEKAGAAIVLGPAGKVGAMEIARAARTLEPPEPRMAMAKAAGALVDGRGAERIARALTALASRPASVRRASAKGDQA